MIRPILHDPLFLAGKSTDASKADLQVITDLKDTLNANREICVGMAANMIGVRKNIIIVAAPFQDLILVNPVIIVRKGPYSAEEGCLSLAGIRKTTRYEEIEVSYLDEGFTPRRQVFRGQTAQIIQHETDHCLGILI